MKNTYTIAKGQSDFPALVRKAQRGGVAVITQRDETVAYLVSRQKWEGVLETMELLANPNFRRQLKRLRAGKVKYHPLAALAG